MARPRLGCIGVEADPVVLHLEEHPIFAGSEPDDHVLRLCVLEHVVERLLGNAEDLAVAHRVSRQLADQHELDLLLPQPAQHLDVLPQRPAETILLEVGRPQLEDERAELLERLSRQNLQLRDPIARGGGVALEHRRGSLGFEHQAEQLLADGVMEVERKSVSLGDDRELPRLLVQARVRDRDRRVRGQQPISSSSSSVNSAASSFSVR